MRYVQYAAIALAGPAVAFAAFRGPERFWPLLLASTITASSAMVSGYPIADEYLLACLILGAGAGLAASGSALRPRSATLLCNPALRSRYAGRSREPATQGEEESATQSTSRKLRSPLRRAEFHLYLFELLIAYLLLQSVRGMIVLEDWRMLRFIFYFAMLGILPLFLRSEALPAPDPGRLCAITAWCGAAYFILYFAHGIYFDLALGPTYSALVGRVEGRFAEQGNLWAGSTYAMFPALASLAAAILLLMARKRAKALFLMVLIFITSLYYQSRMGLLCLAGFAIPSLSLRTARIFLAAAAVILACIMMASPKSEAIVTGRTIAMARGLAVFVHPRESDRDRLDHLVAGAMTLRRGSWRTLLVGEGYYRHRYALRPALSELGSPVARKEGAIQSTGLPAFMVDCGLIGILLAAAVAAAAAYRLATAPFPISGRLVALTALGMALAWTSISNIFDMALFFLLFMPSGLLDRISEAIPGPVAAGGDRRP